MFMKMLRSILLVIILSIVSKCGNEENKFDENKLQISIKEVFSICENKYMLLFYKRNCLASQNVIKTVETDYGKNKFSIYLVECNDNEVIFSNFYFTNIGVKNYLDISIDRVPTMFIVKEKVICFEMIGYKDIKDNYLVFYFM